MPHRHWATPLLAALVLAFAAASSMRAACAQEPVPEPDPELQPDEMEVDAEDMDEVAEGRAGCSREGDH